MGLYRCLLNYVSRPDDDLKEAVRKQIVLVITFFPMPLLVFINIENWTNENNILVGNTGRTIGLVTNAFALAFLMITKTMPLWIPETMMIVGTLGMILVDWEIAAEPVPGIRVWSLIVLVMDVLLIVSARRSVQYAVVCATVVWLLSCAVEDGFRLGLYDIDGWSEHSDSTAEACSSPPCARGASYAATIAAFYLCIFFVDYMATRSFAEGQRRERDRVMYMMTIAEQVAGCLVRFDLESAEVALTEAAAGTVSGDLNASFTKLLRNLARYRPYLPQSCFEDDDEQGGPSTEARSSDAPEAEALPTSRAGQSPRTPISPARGLDAHGSFVGSPGHLSFSGTEGDEHRRQARPSSRRSSLSSQQTEKATTLQKAHVPQQKRITMVCTNRRGFHGVVSRERPTALSAQIAAAVATFNEAVQTQKGVLDLISGDHFSATFGALRSLGAHRQSATRCAYRFSAGPDVNATETSTDRYRIGGRSEDHTSLAITTAVCSGLALCGDYGTSSIMRFMVLGVVSSLCRIAERAAAGWNTAVLVDGAVHSDITIHWNCRLRHMLHHSIGHNPASTSFWEVVDERHGNAGDNEEWMYVLDAAEANPWESYNSILADWCNGQTSELQAKVMQLIERGANSGITAALTAVGEALSAGQPPPVTTLAVGQSHPLGSPGPVGDTAARSSTQ